MIIRIIGLTARNGGEETEVAFEICSDDGEHTSKERFLISSRQYLVLGLAKGDSDEQTYDTVSHASSVWTAVKRGVACLAYGSCSEKALKAKLASKGFDRSIAAEAVEEICSKGLLCANDDAAREAEKMAAKLWGKKRISAGLYSKGYSDSAVAHALSYLVDIGVDYQANCARLLKKRYGGVVDDKDEARKIFSALMRYGYTASEIKSAMLSALEEI